VESCCPVGLRYLSCYFSPKKVTINRGPVLIPVTSGPIVTTHWQETPDAICLEFVRVKYRAIITTWDVRLARYAAMSTASPVTGNKLSTM